MLTQRPGDPGMGPLLMDWALAVVSGEVLVSKGASGRVLAEAEVTEEVLAGAAFTLQDEDSMDPHTAALTP